MARGVNWSSKVPITYKDIVDRTINIDEVPDELVITIEYATEEVRAYIYPKAHEAQISIQEYFARWADWIINQLLVRLQLPTNPDWVLDMSQYLEFYRVEYV